MLSWITQAPVLGLEDPWIRVQEYPECHPVLAHSLLLPFPKLLCTARSRVLTQVGLYGS